MGYNYKFMDNCSYGAEDINLVFSKLTTEGVSLFNYSDGDNPLTSLNEASSNLATPGVENYNSLACMVTYTQSVSDTNTGTYNILPGNAFMYDGAIITIDEDGYDFTQEVKTIRESTSDNIYVYFYRNTPNNTIDIRVTADSSETALQQTVMLGIINSQNEISDKRVFAKTKLIPCSKNIVIEAEQEGFYFSENYTPTEPTLIIENAYAGADHLVVIWEMDDETKYYITKIQNASSIDDLTWTSGGFNRNYISSFAANRNGGDLEVYFQCYSSVKCDTFKYMLF